MAHSKSPPDLWAISFLRPPLSFPGGRDNMYAHELDIDLHAVKQEEMVKRCVKTFSIA